MSNYSNFKFIDLFSGIGGFNLAMKCFNGKCVFASEIDKDCIDVYSKNYSINSDINIKDIDVRKIPKHDVLCAGFPCQSFSKAGKQTGLKDKTRGTLFFDIIRILEYHKPKYIILENVKNIVTLDNNRTWNIIQKNLKSLGYRTTSEPLIVSPHQFGIPQLRERVIILGKLDYKHINNPLEISFDSLKSKNDCSIYSIVTSKRVSKEYYISKYEKKVLNAWDELYQNVKEKVIGFPIWSYYFKVDKLPAKMPKWKKKICKKNRKFYLNNKTYIDRWLIKYNYLKDFIPTHRKFEWQCGTNICTVWDGLIQFRPSGIRVKLATCFPSLVAMVQIPVIGKYKRRLTINEAAQLQSFPKKFRFTSSINQTYKQLGNSVNFEVIKQCAIKLFSTE